MSEQIPFWVKLTPLYELLKEQGATFVDFAGYYMPVNFEKGIVFEHQAVRNDVGLFDISHMGEILILGRDTEAFINHVSTNNITKISNNQMQYHIILNEDGGAIDDMMAYKHSSESVLLVCNASNKDALFEHLNNHIVDFVVEVVDMSEFFAAIALQGPNAEKHLKVLGDFSSLEFMNFVEVDGFTISRSGYTGEDGFEIYGNPEAIVNLTKKLIESGVTLAGLGARDTLRFEAGLPLYGHELADYITPIQAGLGFAIDYSKDFIGKDALLEQKENLTSKIYGLELIDRGIARQGYEVYKDDKVIGFVTSGFMIPGTKNSYANALLEGKYKMGDQVEIEIRNRKIKAVIRKKNYKEKSYKGR